MPPNAAPEPAQKPNFLKGHLPRLTRNNYQGNAVVLWTFTMEHRKTGWLTPEFHATFREILLHASVRRNLLCPTYILMPDHMHLMWMGTQPASDQLIATAFFRTHLQRKLAPCRLQKQAYDSVSRDEDRKRAAFANACNYILENSVRAHLVPRADLWPYSGALVSGYPDLQPLAPDFWPTFWKIYTAARAG